MTRRLRGLLLSLLLLALGAACQDDYLVPPQAGAAPPGTAAPAPPEPPEPEPPSPPEPSTPFEPPPGAFTLQETSDWGCNGAIEHTYWSTYDAEGQLIHQERRLNEGGYAQRCELWWIDPDGAIRTAFNAGCAGVLTECTRLLGLEMGRISLEERDEDCDGQADARSLTEIDPQLGILSQRQEGALGTPDASCSLTIFSYDASGEPLGSIRDRGCDGVADYCHVLLFDAAGRKVGRADDDLCDGAYERCDLDTLGGPDSILAAPEGAGCQGAALSCRASEQRDDLRGVWHVLAYDDDCDGVPELCNRQLVDPEENLLYAGSDDDCDGVDDSSCREERVESTTDALTTTMSTDYDCDGVPEQCNRHVERSSADGERVEGFDGCEGEVLTCSVTTVNATGEWRESWFGCGAPEEHCSSQRYDAAGHTIYEAYSASCAPTPDQCTTRSYDAAGNLTSEDEDEGCDGRPDQCKRNTWDPRGPLLSATTDEDCDGSPEFCFEATPYP